MVWHAKRFEPLRRQKLQALHQAKNGLGENKIIQLAKDNNNHLFIVYGASGYARSPMRIEVMDIRTDKLTTLKEAFPNSSLRPGLCILDRQWR
ncbi:MAG: hypothetical protein WKG06_45540 [Segetibacter sp.]